MLETIASIYLYTSTFTFVKKNVDIFLREGYLASLRMCLPVGEVVF